ncbi:hypothetical protein NQ318_002398 [Aromia moschata]|uniref:Uncharacterized protein n=1 Tax=Aromia moschata TaxID=1265417 RepID=A0AAV8YGC2_9CUCU|nr:hypothetical protein NQ318_002398 [Aromia moschata]
MVEIDVYHSGGHGTSEDDGSDPTIAKATAMVVLFMASFILGTLPIKLYKWMKWENNARNNPYVKFLLGLGGGVLLCTTFIHLVPEVSEHLEEFDFANDVDIPFAELLMCIGFLTMYFVEECVHLYLNRRGNREDLNSLRRSLSVRRGELENIGNRDSLESIESQQKIKPSPEHHVHQGHHGHSHIDHSHLMLDYSEHSTMVIIRGFLVVLALSVHEFFEGLAVGLEGSEGNVWYMFGAVSAHKMVIAFCIGVELVSSGLRTLFVIIYVFTFAVVSPLGIGIGMIVTSLEHGSADLASVILQGMASGTLTYVVFFEILQGDKKSGLKQFFSVLIGFLIMFGLTLID